MTTTATQSLLLLNSEWTRKPPRADSDFQEGYERKEIGNESGC